MTKVYEFSELIDKTGSELSKILKEKEGELEEAIKSKGRLCARIQLLQEQIKHEAGNEIKTT